MDGTLDLQAEEPILLFTLLLHTRINCTCIVSLAWSHSVKYWLPQDLGPKQLGILFKFTKPHWSEHSLITSRMNKYLLWSSFSCLFSPLTNTESASETKQTKQQQQKRTYKLHQRKEWKISLFRENTEEISSHGTEYLWPYSIDLHSSANIQQPISIFSITATCPSTIISHAASECWNIGSTLRK